MTSDNLPPMHIDSQTGDYSLLTTEELLSKKQSCENVLRLSLQVPDKGDAPRRTLERIKEELKKRNELHKEKSSTGRQKQPMQQPTREHYHKLPKFVRRAQARAEKKEQPKDEDDNATRDGIQNASSAPQNKNLWACARNQLSTSQKTIPEDGAQPSKLGRKLCSHPSRLESSRNTSQKRRRLGGETENSKRGAPLDNFGSWNMSNGDFLLRQQVPEGSDRWKNEDSRHRVHLNDPEQIQDKPVSRHPPWRGQPRKQKPIPEQVPVNQTPKPNLRRRYQHNTLPSDQPPVPEQETIILEDDSDFEAASVQNKPCMDPSDDKHQMLNIPMNTDLERALKGVKHVQYPKEGGRGMVMISPRDLQRLDPTEFLNDNCIDLYIKVIESTCPHESRCHFFRSFFFGRLVLSAGYRGDNCRRPTKDIDLFEKDYVFVPIHQDIHWSLAVICFPGNIYQSSDCGGQPCILHLDSMGDGGHDTDEISAVLRGYLAGEWSRKRVGTVPEIDEEAVPHKLVKHIPQQVNSWDCGLFLLTYMEFFSYVAPATLNCHKLQECKKLEFPHFLQRKWFSTDNAGLLRTKLRVFVYNMFIEELTGKNNEAVLILENLRGILQQTKIQYKGPEDTWLDSQLGCASTKRATRRSKDVEGSSSVQRVRGLDGRLMTS